MKKFKIITVREIAARAGCSHSTVARALKNSPLLPLETRRRIQKLAQKMGYHSIPVISNLMTQLRSLRQSPYAPTIAWIHADTRGFGKMFEGSFERASQLGYQAERFGLKEAGMTVERMNKILRSRNIRGLIFSPFGTPRDDWSFQWEHFATVIMGKHPLHLNVTHLEPDEFYNMSLCLENLRRLGYRRLGFITDPSSETTSGAQLSARFAADYYQTPASDRVPMLLALPPKSNQEAQTAKWLKKHRPDVVIGFPRHKEWIENAGFSVPRDIGLALIYIDPIKNLPLDYWSGIHQNDKRRGIVAMTLLDHLLQKNETGTFQFSTSVLIKGEWVEGKTVIDKTGRSLGTRQR